ncbi:MAG: dethiobiotin synthase [Methylococcaceae bacterium]|nr:dethiobiotin synthase [Methylococcaceae bacterium]
MEKSFFITGTDTGAGKTWSTLALMHYFKQQGLSVAGMKPVAAGCEWIDGQLKNEDALLLQQHSSVALAYEEVNPYAFEAPVSPHLAGVDNPVQLDVIVQAFDCLKNKADVVIVEGAGGWLAPINNENDIADLASVLNIPIVMVVAIRLGCINHARLTFQVIQASKVECAGWLAVCVDPEMKKQAENIEAIKARLAIPMLGVLPYVEKMDVNGMAKHIIGRKLI